MESVCAYILNNYYLLLISVLIIVFSYAINIIVLVMQKILFIIPLFKYYLLNFLN